MSIRSFFVASHKVGHLERYNQLESTRWSRLQADWAHNRIGVVQTAACETPATLHD